ncbi:MAG: hypothetical protein Q7S40_09970 [Opitutaceae bacterium]|nr:hypothetical protein [Opitutaceae bacterium]
MPQALVANQRDGLHQGAGGIAQQHPIDGIVDVGLDAGRIQEASVKVDRLFQPQGLGLSVRLPEQFVDEPIERGLVGPVGIALQGALVGDNDAVELGCPAEVLEEGAVGEADSEAAKVLLQERAQEIATQSAAGVELEVQLDTGADRRVTLRPGFEAVGDETSFAAGEPQQFVDAQELVAHLAVIDIALDRGQGWAQGFGERNKGDRHYSL